MVLVQGLPGIATKKARGVFHVPAGMAVPDAAPLQLKFPDDTSYRLRVAGRQAEFNPAKTSRLILESENVQQILHEWPGGLVDQYCELIWAGDLDGDGELDLLMNVSDHYKVTEHVLFRSSKRTQGNFVQRAGSFRATGC